MARRFQREEAEEAEQSADLTMRRHIDLRLGTDSIFTPPKTSNSLRLRVEINASLPVKGVGTTTRNTLLVTREAEHGQRNGDGHINTNLPGLDFALEAAGCGPGAREDGRAVAVFVCVDQTDCFVEGGDVEAH